MKKLGEYGYTNKILEINLSREKWVTYSVDTPILHSYIGGRGFTSIIQYERIKPGVDALEPENVLIFATGPLTGTKTVASSRFTIGGKSPLTGLLGDSNAGGDWGVKLKQAGYDAIIVTGRANKPVYILIDNNKIEIYNADSLWGKTTYETEELIKKIHRKKTKVLSIGPAGEQLVRYACVISEHYRAAGRTGMGAVMGSKNLKAIAVNGTGEIPIFDPPLFKEKNRFVRQLIKDDPVSGELASKIGTLKSIASVNELGGLSTRNWQTCVFPDIDKIKGETILDKYKVGTTTCHSCFVGCGQMVEIPEKYYGGAKVKIEYYTAVSFSSKCGNSNIESVIKAIDLCNKYGLDVGSTGQTIAFAMECYEKGYLGKDETDQLGLEWGNADTILKLVEKIAFRDGFGDLLAEGIKRMSEIIGHDSDKFAVHIKGMSPPTIDPRAVQNYNFRYVIGSRGGDHLRAQGVLGYLMDKMSVSKAIERLLLYEQICTLIDMIGVCKFPYLLESVDFDSVLNKMEALSLVYQAVTGDERDLIALFQVAKKHRTIDRIINVREGIDKKDDTLPYRFLHEPLPEGPKKGNMFTNIEELLLEYYRQHHWNTETGIPLDHSMSEKSPWPACCFEGKT